MRSHYYFTVQLIDWNYHSVSTLCCCCTLSENKELFDSFISKTSSATTTASVCFDVQEMW